MLAIRRYPTATAALDAALRLYRTYFGVLFVISLVTAIPTMVFQTLVPHLVEATKNDALTTWWNGIDPHYHAFTALGITVGSLLLLSSMIVAPMFGVAACTRVASTAALGESPALRDALGAAVGRLGSIIAASMGGSLVGLLVLATAAAPLALVMLLAQGNILATSFSVLILLAGVVVSLWVYLGFVFVGPAVVLETMNAGDALARSWSLMNGRRGRVVSVTALIVLLTIVGTTVAGVAAALGRVFAGAAGESVGGVLGQLVGAFITPLWTVAIVLLYYDARVDTEAFDVQVLARQQHERPPS